MHIERSSRRLHKIKSNMKPVAILTIEVRDLVHAFLQIVSFMSTSVYGEFRMDRRKRSQICL